VRIERIERVSRGLTLDAVPITAGKDEQVVPEITDADLSEEFRRYHAQVAALDFVKNQRQSRTVSTFSAEYARQ